MNTQRTMFSCWLLCTSLIASLSSFAGTALAQGSQSVRASFEGQWTGQRGRGPAETLLDFEAEGLLTEEAEAYRAGWAIEDDDQALCRRQSPASFAGSGRGIEIFVRRDIVYLIADEQMRRVNMDGRERPPGFWPNELGWSEGEWEGNNTLVVRTTDFTAGTLDAGNRPFPFGSPAGELLERYTLSDDGSRLHLDYHIEDPMYYVAPINLRFDFVRSDETIATVDCLPGLY